MKGYKFKIEAKKFSFLCTFKSTSVLTTTHLRVPWANLCHSRLYPPIRVLRIWPLDLESGRISGWVADTFWHAH